MIPDITPPDVDRDAFLKAMSEPPAVSIKLNRRKCKDPAELGYGNLEPVVWCKSGFYLEERPKFTLNPLLHAGAFYVQDASSMIYETIVEQLLTRYRLAAHPLVLDLCAAPGGKTTSMINALPDGALVVANEVMPKRAFILLENLTKWGYPDILVCNEDVRAFTSTGVKFDIIAVDAPCSGEGMMRKDPEAVSQWNPGLVAHCASLQREILSRAVDSLEDGGLLIYSTCTFNTAENEENVVWLAETLGLEPLEMNFPTEWGIGTGISCRYPCYRFMPHITRGEGLFVAVLRKPGTLAPDRRKDKTLEKLKKNLRIVSKPDSTLKNGKTGKAKKIDDRPDITEPLSAVYDGRYPEVELSMTDALKYLRREALVLDPEVPKGYVVVKYRGYSLGFVKNLGNRANNLYPAEWRIRNL